MLARRVKRNPEEGWAWRALTYRRLSEYECAGTEKRHKLRPWIEKLLACCDRTAPEEPDSLGAHALWLEVCGH